MRYAIFAYSKRGLNTAESIMSAADGEWRAYTVERLSGGVFSPIPKPSAPLFAECFSWADAIVFVGACGIAVRAIAPHVRSKTHDPAVIVVDELGKFIIPILSGHIGGANALASLIASKTGALPVITTATDINGRFSVDSWAVGKGLLIDSMIAAKHVSAAILERDIPVKSDFPMLGSLPQGLFEGSSGETGIYVTFKNEKPFDITLRLIPKVLHLGLGCRRGISAEAVKNAVEQVFEQNKLDFNAVGKAASIDLEANEAGLLEFCREKGIGIDFHSAEELRRAEGDFTSSEFVAGITGVDNVCERAAIMDAERLIVRKTAVNGVTVAVAAEKYEVNFE